MNSLGVSASAGIDQNLIIHLDASLTFQYTNSSGTLYANSAINLVSNNITTVTGSGTNSLGPRGVSCHNNIPGTNVRMFEFNRANSNYLQVSFSQANYLADFSTGLTLFVVASFAGPAGAFERLVDISSSSTSNVNSLLLYR